MKTDHLIPASRPDLELIKTVRNLRQMYFAVPADYWAKNKKRKAKISINKWTVNWITMIRKSGKTYSGHTETLDSCFDFIRSHQQWIPWSPPLEIELTLGGQSDPLGIVQEAKIWPCEQIVYAQHGIHPDKWDAQKSGGFWETNRLLSVVWFSFMAYQPLQVI